MSLHLVILSGVILEQETHTILKNTKSFIPCFKVPKLHKQSFLRYEKRKDNLVILGRVSTDKNIIDAIKIFKNFKKKYQVYF